MPNLNQVTLIGNVTRDVQIRHTPSGTAVAEIGLAINRHWTDQQGQKQEDTVFVDITYFARAAEVIGQYVQKGDPFCCTGRLALDQWDDKQTGQKRQKLKVIGEGFQLLGNRRDGQQQPQRQQQRPAQQQGWQPQAQPQQSFGPGQEQPSPYAFPLEQATPW